MRYKRYAITGLVCITRTECWCLCSGSLLPGSPTGAVTALAEKISAKTSNNCATCWTPWDSERLHLDGLGFHLLFYTTNPLRLNESRALPRGPHARLARLPMLQIERCLEDVASHSLSIPFDAWRFSRETPSRTRVTKLDGGRTTNN